MLPWEVRLSGPTTRGIVMRNSVFGLSLSDITKFELVELLVRDFVPSGNGPRLIATANLDHVANLTRFPEYRDAYNSAWLITADGTPVYVYARLRGIPLAERVTGADLFPELVSRFTQRHRPFLVASSEQAVQGAFKKLKAIGVATEHFEYVVPPFGFEDDEAYSNALTKKIRDHGTTHLLMCIGSPKSEVWVWRHRAVLGDLYAIGLGASLEFFAGTVTRAPRLFRKLGFEWVWRLANGAATAGAPISLEFNAVSCCCLLRSLRAWDRSLEIIYSQAH